jgi:hypothetical protein
MRQVLGPLALALRVVIKDQITRNTLSTFHGPLVGGRILSGLINRGAVLLMIPALLLLHYGVVLREEQYLERKFGQVYRDYKARVPRYGWKL